MSHFVLSRRLSACAMSVFMLTPPLTSQAPVYAEEPSSENMLQSERPVNDQHTGDSSKQSDPDSNSLPVPAPLTGAVDHDNYPSIGEMEKVAFGRTRPDLPVTERLNQLEQTIYHQTFPSLSLFDRNAKLQETLLGENKQQTKQDDQTQAAGLGPVSASDDQVINETLNQPYYQTEADILTLENFALELINQKREMEGMVPLEPDKIAQKVAAELSEDLCKRNSFSHLNRLGENPDVRYTKAGGSDSLAESLAIISGAPVHRLNRALVARMIQQIGSHEDQLASLLSPAATNFAFGIGVKPGSDTAIGCAEVVTKQAQLVPIPQQLEVGGHLEIAGTVLPPYRFYKVTLAWERDGKLSTAESDTPQADPAPVIGAEQFEKGEELPYFPPADYVAYEKNVPKDRTKLYGALKIAAVLGVIGGGIVVPGLAAAAPLILLIPVGKKPPISNVPIHAGVKIHGRSFSGDIPVSDEQKTGLYYLTVWATKGRDTSALFPISRRTILVKDAPTSSANDSASGGAVDGEAQTKNPKRV